MAVSANSVVDSVNSIVDSAIINCIKECVSESFVEIVNSSPHNNEWHSMISGSQSIIAEETIINCAYQAHEIMKDSRIFKYTRTVTGQKYGMPVAIVDVGVIQLDKHMDKVVAFSSPVEYGPYNIYQLITGTPLMEFWDRVEGSDEWKFVHAFSATDDSDTNNDSDTNSDNSNNSDVSSNNNDHIVRAQGYNAAPNTPNDV